MGWMIGNTGFEMTPAAEVPDLIEKHLHGWLTEWLASAGAPFSRSTHGPCSRQRIETSIDEPVR